MRRAYTLIELLVCIAVIALLASLLMPAVQHAREAARTAQCRSNLHQLGVEIARKTDARGIIPGIFAPSIEDGWRTDIPCPSFVGQYPERSRLMCYTQTWSDCTREHVMEATGLPSVAIELMYDTLPVHSGNRVVLYLDGHVGMRP